VAPSMLRLPFQALPPASSFGGQATPVEFVLWVLAVVDAAAASCGNGSGWSAIRVKPAGLAGLSLRPA